MQSAQEGRARAMAALNASRNEAFRWRLASAFAIALSGGAALFGAALIAPALLAVGLPAPFDALPDAAVAAILGVVVATLTFWPIAATLSARRAARARQPFELLAASLAAADDRRYPRLRRYGDRDADAIAAAVNKLSARLHAHDTRLNRPVGKDRFGQEGSATRMRQERMAARVVSMLMEASSDGFGKAGDRDRQEIAGEDLPSIMSDVASLARAGDHGGLAATANEIDRAFNDLNQALETLRARG